MPGFEDKDDDEYENEAPDEGVTSSLLYSSTFRPADRRESKRKAVSFAASL
jgi:hypothetical protein